MRCEPGFSFAYVNQSISTYLVPRLHKSGPTRHYKCHHSTRIVKTSAVIVSNTHSKTDSNSQCTLFYAIALTDSKPVDTTRRMMFTLISSSAPQAHSAQYVCLSPTPHRHTGTLYANSMKTIGLINNVLQSTPTISSPPPPHSTKCNSPPTNGQRTNIRCLLILEDLTSSTFSQNSVCVVNLSNSV